MRRLEGRYEKASTETPGRGEDGTRTCEGRNTRRRDAGGPIQSNDGHQAFIARNFSYNAPTILLEYIIDSPCPLQRYYALAHWRNRPSSGEGRTCKHWQSVGGVGIDGHRGLGRACQNKKTKKNKKKCRGRVCETVEHRKRSDRHPAFSCPLSCRTSIRDSRTRTRTPIIHHLDLERSRHAKPRI
jgi:hypothetical protein